MKRARQWLIDANSWQRLWLVLAVLWLVGSVTLTLRRFPNEEEMRLGLIASRAISGLTVPALETSHCDTRFPNEGNAKCHLVNMKIYGEQLILYRALLEERQAWETKSDYELEATFRPIDYTGILNILKQL